MPRLVIFGAGGFGREVRTAARGVDNVLADDRCRPGVIRPEEITSTDDVVIAISDVQTRRIVAKRFAKFGAVAAPTAVVGHNVFTGEGSIFCDFTMVTGDAEIGRHFHCNIYSYVAHDCRIGDFVTFAPKVCCNGNVYIGDGAYIGAGAIIKNGLPGRPLTIGNDAVVGCGAVVTRDVAPGSVVVGNPARPIERKISAVA